LTGGAFVVRVGPSRFATHEEDATMIAATCARATNAPLVVAARATIAG
jgi:hypothetical protein